MKETNSDCGRDEQLVAYFYGEATPAERAGFEQHLAACAACRDELAAFGRVRAGVAEWRAELLNSAPALAFEGAPVRRPQGEAETMSPQMFSGPAAPRRSARTALREFFTLSPAWLRVATCTAALALCALATLAVLNAQVRWENGSVAFSTGLRTRPQQPAQPAPWAQTQGVTQAELNQLIAERDAARRELEETRAQLEDSRAANLYEALYETEMPASRADVPAPGAAPPRATRRTPANGGVPARRRAPRGEREEDGLPRLYDLLNDAY